MDTEDGIVPEDPSLEIALAMLRVLTRRLGTEFARDVRDEISRKAKEAAADGTEYGAAMAEHMRKTVRAPIWSALGVID